MRRSFSVRLLLHLMLAATVPTAAFALVLHASSRQASRRAVTDRLRATAAARARHLGETVSSLEGDLEGLAGLAASHLAPGIDPGARERALKKYARVRNGILCMDRYFSAHQNGDGEPRISNVWVLEPDPLPSETLDEIVASEALDAPFYRLLAGHSLIRAVYLATANGVLRYAPWVFTLDTDGAALDTGEPEPFYTAADPYHDPRRTPVWTPPYFEADEDRWVVTCSVPVYVGERFRGVVCGDVPLERLEAMVADPAQGGGEIPLLVDREGIVLLDSLRDPGTGRPAEVATRNLVAESAGTPAHPAVADMVSGAAGARFFREEPGGRTWAIAYVPVPGTPWRLALRADANAALAVATALSGRILRLGSALLPLSLLLAALLTLHVVRPLRGLARDAARLRRGSGTPRSRLVQAGALESLSRTLEHLGVEMKQQRDVLSEQNTRLEESRERFRTLVENVRDVIYTLDAGGALTYANQRWQETLGYTPDSLLGRSFSSLLHPEDRPAFEEAFGLCMECRADARDLLYRIADRQGAWRWHRLDATSLRGRDGDAPFFMGIAEDVTEKRLLEQHMVQAQKMESVGALAGGIAHDIGNLLTPLLGYSQMVRDHSDNPELVLELAEVLDVNLSKLDQLTRQLLLFGRRSDVRFHPMDLTAAITEALKLLGPSLPEGIRLDVRLPEEPRILRGDPNQIQQALMNLCLNAADAMPRGGTLSVRLDETLPDNRFLDSHPGSRPVPYLRIDVCDTGIGMDRETQKQIFEPFFTTKERGKGTGLGLPMVLKIVEDHAGFVDCESDLGKGTALRIYLPAIEEATAGSDPAGSRASGRLDAGATAKTT